MGLFSFLRGDDLDRKAITGTSAVLETLTSRQFSAYPALGGTNLSGQRIGSAYVKVQNGSYSWLYLYSPAVRRVVDYIARNIAQLGLKVYERVSDDEREHRGDHPAAEALRNPNPQTPGNYFVQQFVKSHLIYGNAYALKFRGRGEQLQLVILNPAQVGIVGQSHFTVDAYRIYRPDGTSFDRPPEDILHWPTTSGDDPRLGESYLETLRELLAADQAAMAAVTEVFRSGLSMPAWLERPIEAPDWSEQGRQRFQESATNMARQAKRTLPVFEEGMQLKQGGVTPEDAELLEGRRFTLEQVATLFGMKNIPPEGEEERKQFYADVLPPFTDLFASHLDLHVLVREYAASDHYFEFNLDEKLMGDDRLKALTSAAGAPVLTRNEARARLNLPAKPGGDKLIVPLNVTDGDPSKPSPNTMPIQDPNKPPQDGSHRSGEAETPAPAGRRHINRDDWTDPALVPNGHRPLMPAGQKELLIPRRRRASERRDRWAGEYQGVLDRHFERQRRSIKSKQAQTKAIADDRWNKELGDGLNDVAERQFGAEGAHVAFRLASTFDPDQGQNWIAAKSIGAAEAINQTTQQHADESDLAKAFDQAKTRAPGAAMAFATSVAAFSMKVATEQAPGDPTVTIDGGECEVCAPFQGSWLASELEAWPAYHPSCGCVADVQAAPTKAVAAETKAESPTVHNHIAPQPVIINFPEGFGQVNVEPTTVNGAPVNIYNSPPEFNVPEGALQVLSPINVEPAQVHVEQPSIHVSPSEFNMAKGAISVPVNVEAATPADIRFDKGAFAISTPVNVEAPIPPDVQINVEPTNVNVEQPNVTVEAAQPPNVHIEQKGGKTKKTVTFSDGRTAEIDETSETKKTVKFSDGRVAEINEEEE